ncbi:MAG TPA: GNAT family N-acetyltransferase [Rhizomicrobium sp.]|nr:GNAT family N-acetyltransferase [Rhizomicrobium sp.]
MSEVKLAISDAEVARVFSVMHALRTHIADTADFVTRVQRQRRTERGWQLLYVEDNGAPVAAASFRILEHLAWGKVLYVDDLICAESHRGKGFADVLMAWMENRAREENCTEMHLDSGTQRAGAHKFYFRMGLAISSFHFAKKL